MKNNNKRMPILEVNKDLKGEVIEINGSKYKGTMEVIISNIIEVKKETPIHKDNKIITSVFMQEDLITSREIQIGSTIVFRGRIKATQRVVEGKTKKCIECRWVSFKGVKNNIYNIIEKTIK